jgi:predicted O-methyltransferase YrrM
VNPRFGLPRSPFRGKYRDQWLALARERPSALRHVLRWALSRRSGRSAIADGVPWVPFVALRWLSRHVRRDMRVFEWGSGGSTIFFARRVRELISVEHDAAWHALVAERLRRERSSSCRYELIEPRPAPPGGTEFGSGQPGHTHLCFEDYVRAIERYPEGHFDMVMIDGRARMACLRAAFRHVKVGGIVYLDNSNYERYQAHLDAPPGFERRDLEGVSPYGGDVWTQSTIWTRAR